MALIPLKIPSGVYRTGTDYESQGRWCDSNLMRWSNGSMRPVGGWVQRWDISSDLTAPPRGMHCWMDNSFAPTCAMGSANELLYVNAGGVAYDITPAGFTTGDADASINVGFGGSFYGNGLYGVRRTQSANYEEADTWSLDNWGEYLVACSTSDGKLYEWQLSSGTPAAQIANSPTGCKALIVTDERFIFALQADGNPRKIAWCDREDNTTWTAAATNEAGDIEIQTSGEIMTACKLRGRTLILTTTDAHTATYQGSPYVYGFEKVGNACGVISRKAVAPAMGGAFWMGKEAFFMFDGSQVTPIRCDVQDYIFGDLNESQSSKIFALHNSEYGEIWWFFPSENSTECDKYVAYDYSEGHWETGSMGRTTGFDQGIYSDPIWSDASGIVYDQEIHGGDHGGAMPYAITTPFEIGNGDQVMKVNQLIPDTDTHGDVEFSFYTRFYPQDTEREYGAYSANHPTSVRFTGRQIKMKVQATNNSDFRVGTIRINAEAGGRR